MLTPSGYILEHRLVAERILGRYLDYRSEPILHLNGEPVDNRPSNLYVFESMSHMKRAVDGDDVFPTRSNLDPLTYDLRPKRWLKIEPRISHGAGRKHLGTRRPGEGDSEILQSIPTRKERAS